MRYKLNTMIMVGKHLKCITPYNAQDKNSNEMNERNQILSAQFFTNGRLLISTEVGIIAFTSYYVDHSNLSVDDNHFLVI